MILCKYYAYMRTLFGGEVTYAHNITFLAKEKSRLKLRTLSHIVLQSEITLHFVGLFMCLGETVHELRQPTDFFI
jgi:hypothetical protein